MDTLLESLVKAGGNRIDSIGYETSDLRKYRDQARDNAVKARAKSRRTGQSAGTGIGKAQSIDEVPDYGFSAGLQANIRFENDSRGKLAAPTIAAGQKTISASVTVSFELN